MFNRFLSHLKSKRIVPKMPLNASSHQNSVDSTMESLTLSLKIISAEPPSEHTSDQQPEDLPAASLPASITKKCADSVHDVHPMVYLQPTEDEAPADDDWPPKPTAEETKRQLETADDYKVSIVSYIIINLDGEEELHNINVKRHQVREMLPYFHHLRANLLASTKILATYTPEVFAEPRLHSSTALHVLGSSSSNLANDQRLFTFHHNSVAETLKHVDDCIGLYSFGLPGYSIFTQARNYFCHGLLRPGKPMWWASTMKTLPKAHEELLRQVELTTVLLEERLANKGEWKEPPVEEKIEEDWPEVEEDEVEEGPEA